MFIANFSHLVLQAQMQLNMVGAKISGKIKYFLPLQTKKNFPVEPAWNTALRVE